MVAHRATERDADTCLWVALEVRIHDKDGDTELEAAIDERQHRAKL